MKGCLAVEGEREGEVSSLSGHEEDRGGSGPFLEGSAHSWRVAIASEWPCLLPKPLHSCLTGSIMVRIAAIYAALNVC